MIESPFGFHIFKLEKQLPARDPTLEEVREQIRGELERERLEELRRDWLRLLQRKADISVDEDWLEQLR